MSFLATHLVGFAATTSDPVDISYTTGGLGSTNGTSPTPSFTDLAIGAAAADRKVVACIYVLTLTGRTITGVTIGGIAATQVKAASNGGAGVRMAEFWVADVPTGTTATVAVTISGGNILGAGAIVYRMTGAGSSTPFDTDEDTDGSDPQTGSIDVPANGAAIGFTFGNTSGRTFAWTGLTEDVDAATVGGNSWSSASGEFATAQSGLAISNDITATPENTTLTVSIFASWGQ
jgi:hypothetical protein